LPQRREGIPLKERKKKKGGWCQNGYAAPYLTPKSSARPTSEEKSSRKGRREGLSAPSPRKEKEDVNVKEASQ